MNTQSKYDLPLPIDWNTDAIVDRRETYYVASQRAFVPYQTPQIFERGKGQYLWGVDEFFDCYEHLLSVRRRRVFYLPGSCRSVRRTHLADVFEPRLRRPKYGIL